MSAPRTGSVPYRAVRSGGTNSFAHFADTILRAERRLWLFLRLSPGATMWVRDRGAMLLLLIVSRHGLGWMGQAPGGVYGPRGVTLRRCLRYGPAEVPEVPLDVDPAVSSTMGRTSLESRLRLSISVRKVLSSIPRFRSAPAPHSVSVTRSLPQGRHRHATFLIPPSPTVGLGGPRRRRRLGIQRLTVVNAPLEKLRPVRDCRDWIRGIR